MALFVIILMALLAIFLIIVGIRAFKTGSIETGGRSGNSVKYSRGTSPGNYWFSMGLLAAILVFALGMIIAMLGRL